MWSERCLIVFHDAGKEGIGGEGMEWHSDGAEGEFTILMSFTGTYAM